ncbi:MAG: zinc ABC transporter solute-binding protein [Tissierellia bacterium]|nr:zinc ABC transporter solute-binding protein [Tissierellia bacterium]
MIKRLLVLILMAALLLSSCERANSSEEERPIVYASFYPIYDMVDSVAGNHLEVRSFQPTEKDPHLWEPSPKDIKKLQDGDLLIVNGANMEMWLDNIKTALPELDILVLSDGVELITYNGAAAIGDFQYMTEMNLSKSAYKISFGHTHEDLMRVAFFKNDENYTKEELIKKGKEIMRQDGKLVKQRETIEVEDGVVYGIEMGHESGTISYKVPSEGSWIFVSDRISEELLTYNLLDEKGENIKNEVLLEHSTSQMDKITYDPHSWLSIVNAKLYLNSIQMELSNRFPHFDKDFRKNKVRTVERLTSLEYEYKDKFKETDIKEFVVTHNAYSYLARDFYLIQFPLQNLVSMEDPSLKTIKTAIDFCNYYGISIIFYEYGNQEKGARTIAEEIGGKTLPLASMEFITKEQRGTDERYVDLMEKNLENLYESMKVKK